MSENPGTDETFDALTRMVRVLGDDTELSEWFVGLGLLSSVDRRNEVFRMHEDLLSQDPAASDDVVAPLKLLADDRVFAAAQQAFAAL